MKDLTKQSKIYAIYDKDNWITDGTLKEIANYLGITLGTLQTYKAKKKKYIFIELDEVENENNLFNGTI